MDEENELAKLKYLGIASIAFLVSAYISFQEFKYAVWGVTTQAAISRKFETEESAGRRRTELLAVEYSFKDETGKSHNERDDVPRDFPVPNDFVNVQYFPGVKDSSRIEGHSSKVGVWVFVACGVVLCVAGYKLYAEASEAVHGKKRRRE